MKKIIFSLLLGTLFFIGCSEDDAVSAPSCDGTFDPSGLTFVASDAQYYMGTEECGDANVTPTDQTSTYSNYSWAFAADKTVAMYIGTVTPSSTPYYTYDWCVTGTALTVTMVTTEVKSWTLTANDAATEENSRAEGCYDASMTLTNNAQADCASPNMWYNASCTAITYGATATPS